MQLLIDGYNLLKKIKHSAHISDKERRNFIKKLNNYAHTKNLELIIVFDAGPYSWPMCEKVSKLLEVVYSGVQESADDYIKKYVEAHKNRDILLITSDRELVTHARRHGIDALGSHEFADFLHANESPVMHGGSIHNQRAHKMIHSAHKELDFLMEKLFVPQLIEENEADLKYGKNKNKLSKIERKVLKKIKKL